ncbi:DUF1493 family protein [Bradyrhizobium sp. SZCCHNS3004]|uniref:DUF1493 family protein n=1 Tax=Bradyrhizobium sp. SZCCHNS3004 TaxID=3057312 RepID=UPI002916054E|nr:DUF1493 family protein [Bradyrhizobium sp. SZCCHNS3004]
MAGEPNEGEICNRVMSFLMRETRTKTLLSNDTDIARDLGVDGDDAAEMIQRFQHEFGIEMSEFEFDRYFGREGFSLIGFLKNLLLSHPNKKPLTIKMLCDVAKKGRWPKA